MLPLITLITVELDVFIGPGLLNTGAWMELQTHKTLKPIRLQRYQTDIPHLPHFIILFPKHWSPVTTPNINIGVNKQSEILYSGIPEMQTGKTATG